MKSTETKRQEATERQARYDALSTAEKIAQTDARPGESRREIERLMRAQRAADNGKRAAR